MEQNPWPIIQTIITVVCSVLASSGFWALLQKKSDKKDATSNMLMGLGHDRIEHLAMNYIEKGFVTQYEYENLHRYLYKPYKDLGGNGSAEHLMNEVNKLPVRDDKEE